MMRYMTMHGATDANPETLKFVTYLNVVLRQKYTMQQLGVRTSKELSTLAMVLDALLSGNIGRASDVLIQRWRALESSVADGHWHMAQQLELVPPDEISLLWQADRQLLAKREMLMHKLDEARRKAKDHGGTGR